jgi:hypothetical protein
MGKYKPPSTVNRLPSPLSYVLAPTFVLRKFAANGIVIHVLDLACSGASLAFANRAEINFAQTNALGSRTADKDFIRILKLVA